LYGLDIQIFTAYVVHESKTHDKLMKCSDKLISSGMNSNNNSTKNNDYLGVIISR
jgi:hypothetical protein